MSTYRNPLQWEEFFGGSIRWYDISDMEYNTNEEDEEEKFSGMRISQEHHLIARKSDQEICSIFHTSGCQFLLSISFPNVQTPVSGVFYVRERRPDQKRQWQKLLSFRTSGDEQNIANFVGDHGLDSYGLLIPHNNPVFLTLAHSQVKEPITKMIVDFGTPTLSRMQAKVQEELWGRDGFDYDEVMLTEPAKYPKLMQTVQICPTGVIHYGQFRSIDPVQ